MDFTKMIGNFFLSLILQPVISRTQPVHVQLRTCINFFLSGEYNRQYIQQEESGCQVTRAASHPPA